MLSAAHQFPSLSLKAHLVRSLQVALGQGMLVSLIVSVWGEQPCEALSVPYQGPVPKQALQLWG